jgi:hypothetical protein
MKRIIAVLSLSVFAAPAFAQPYEKTQFDRGLYNVEQSASSGQTMTNAGSSVWANDHNFIAPAP